MNETDLQQKGWQQQPDGSWSKAPPVDRLETRRAEQPPLQALVSRVKKRTPSKGSVAIRVTLVSCRHRLLDPDAISFSCKPLTDSIAAWLGVDDADPRVQWNWQQVQVPGEQGVIVKIEIV